MMSSLPLQVDSRLSPLSLARLLARTNSRLRVRLFGPSIFAMGSALAIGLCACTDVFGQAPKPVAVTASIVAEGSEEPTEKGQKEEEKGWQRIDTGDAKLWKSANFGGDGEITLSPEGIKMGLGDPISGVVCLAELPTDQYEIELESRRLSNFDFFCGLTFPVGKSHCSFIVGGWAGAVVGLSSIDGEDASENKTKKLMNFDNERWYRIRVRVSEAKVQAWIDDELIVDQVREGHEFSIRAEMHASLPLGVSAFQCDSELRNVRWRKL